MLHIAKIITQYLIHTSLVDKDATFLIRDSNFSFLSTRWHCSLQNEELMSLLSGMHIHKTTLHAKCPKDLIGFFTCMVSVRWIWKWFLDKCKSIKSAPHNLYTFLDWHKWFHIPKMLFTNGAPFSIDTTNIIWLVACYPVRVL